MKFGIIFQNLLIATIILLPGVFAQYYCPGYCGMMHGNYGIGFMILGWIITILIIVLIIVLIYWLIRSLNKKIPQKTF